MEKLKREIAISIIGLIVVLDLVLVNLRYVNSEDFVNTEKVENPFEPSGIDRQILKDTTRYRILDNTTYPFNTARTTFFHSSIGGYHAAKPKRMQNLYEFYIFNKKAHPILDALNVKYVIEKNDTNGRVELLKNPKALGNAWFVESVTQVADYDTEILSLDTLQFPKNAVTVSSLKKKTFRRNNNSSIQLKATKPNFLAYNSINEYDGFAVFSEMYYKNGWKAFIDGKETQILKVNYAFRGLQIPAGAHTITFEFDPQVVKIGSVISLITTLCFLVFMGVMLYKNRDEVLQQWNYFTTSQKKSSVLSE